MGNDAARSELGGLMESSEPTRNAPEAKESIDDGIEEPLPEPPTPEQLDKAERLIRESRLQKMRGNKTVAGKLLEEALDTAPGSVAVLSAIADDLLERRQSKAAMELYKRALRIDPKNVAVERKYAECVLGTAQFADPTAYTRGSELDAASGKIAVILSLFVPGLGQIVTGSVQLGVFLLVGWLGGWGIAWMIPNGIKGILGLFNNQLQGAKADFNGVVLLPLLFAAICHIWAIFDAASKSGEHQKKRVDRPTPPVDKDFEI